MRVKQNASSRKTSKVNPRIARPSRSANATATSGSIPVPAGKQNSGDTGIKEDARVDLREC